MVTILKPHRHTPPSEQVDIASEELPGNADDDKRTDKASRPEAGVELSEDNSTGTGSGPGEGPNPTAS